MKTESIVKEILKSSAFSIAELESSYNSTQKKLETKNIVSLTIKELKLLLAYEFLKDGAEIPMVKEILKSKNPKYQNKVDLLKQLEIFGY